MGLGMAATVLGLFVAFVLLLLGLIWLPVKRLLRARKQKITPEPSTQKYTESLKASDLDQGQM